MGNLTRRVHHKYDGMRQPVTARLVQNVKGPNQIGVRISQGRELQLSTFCEPREF